MNRLDSYHVIGIITVIFVMHSLVLNFDFSPVGICSVEKAFVLIYLQKADEIQQFDGKALHTVDASYHMPAVVKLKRYVNIPYRSVELSRSNVFKRDRHECQYCGSKKDLTLDHVHPRSKGGRSNWKNLVTACKHCNAKKGDYLLEEAGLLLKSDPYKPSYIMFLRDFSGFDFEEWIPYLQMTG